MSHRTRHYALVKFPPWQNNSASLEWLEYLRERGYEPVMNNPHNPYVVCRRLDAG